jgi:D-cysteine desulfhydrase family pyridoxal phosphate-dependent enzyme
MDLASRIRLADLPTPLEPLDRLSAELRGPRVWIKRDDAAGLGGGGNKLRKLEFLLAAARDEGADIVLTSGAVQSNHARLTAAACARLGIACELWLNRRVAGRPAAYERTGNVLLDRLLGARIELVDGDIDPEPAAERRADALRRDGRRPFVIPAGGSNALGALGYVECAREILAQARTDFGAIVVASGSGGTLAGLAAGLGGAGWRGRLVGVSVSAPAAEMHGRVAALVADLPGEPAVFTIEDRFYGSSYGVPTKAGGDAIRLFARTEGVFLDPVYTGKAAAALIALAPELTGDVLFLHTGGFPALFAHEEEFA